MMSQGGFSLHKELKAHVDPDVEQAAGGRAASATREHAASLLPASMSEQLGTALLEAAPDAIVAVSREGSIVVANSQAERTFGWAREELLGLPIETLLPQRLRSAHVAHRALYAEAPRTRSMGLGLDFTAVRKDGSEFPCEISLSPLETEAGTLVIAIVHDVTERERATAQRAQLYRAQAARVEAEAANKAKDEFLAVLSHELRAPLNAIRTWSTLLSTGRLGPEKTARAIDSIKRNTLLQVRLIEDLLDISRIVSKKLMLELEAVDLATVAEAAIDAVREEAAARSLRVTTDLQPGVVVQGDRARLQQIIWNVLSNAVKFSPDGSLVQIRVSQQGDCARLQVIDQGHGIEPEFLPHIFEPFRQGDSSSTRSYAGLGLGLAIVHHLTLMHGGQVTAESEGVDRGATFTVSLPLRSDLTSSPPDDGSGPDWLRSLEGIRILLVDDDRESLEPLAEALAQAGATVTTAESAEKAIAGLGPTKPDVVVSDVATPAVDGYSLVRRLRALGLKIPAVALTAYAGPEDRKRALGAGYSIHLSKPLDPAELIRTILWAYVRG